MGKLKILTAAELGLVNNSAQHIPQIHADQLTLESLGKLKYEVLSDRQVTLDHAKATEYIDLPVFKGEREVLDSHVQFLYDEMRAGTFNPLLIILSTALLNGTTYKINGQHTCWAINFMHGNYSIIVREIRYKVGTIEQLKMLYATYDRLKARSDAHVSKVFLAETPAAAGLWNSTLEKTIPGFRLWHLAYDDVRRRVSPEQVAAMIQKTYPALFNTVGLYVQEHWHADPLARRTPLIAAMFATFDKVASKAPEFWDPVLTGIGLTTKSDPRWALRDVLLKVSTKPGKSAEKTTRLINNEGSYQLCLMAWNKWRKGETVRAALRVPDGRPKIN